MNDLETIPFHAVKDPKEVSYEMWRKQQKPKYRIVWRDIILGYVSLVLVFIASYFIKLYFPSFNVLNFIFSTVVAGFILAYISLFIHEAGHFNTHPNKKTNDLLANIFLCLPFGLDIKTYRKIHWQHHLHLGTTADTENSYFKALNTLFIIELFTGFHVLKVVLNKNSSALLSKEMQINSRKMLLSGALLNITIIVAFIFINQIFLAAVWLIAIAVFFPLFAALRQVLEHRNELALKKINYKKENHGKIARLFTSDFFSRTFGGAGFNKHMIHHWDPQLSYTRIKDAEHFLLNCDATQKIVSTSKTTYAGTLKKLLSW